MAFLELNNITKRFGNVTAINDVTVEIQQGEFLTLLGPSGCGKTTLLRMIAGFEQPDSGSILLNGKNIVALPANKRPMGMVFQSYALFPHMTAEQNIAFGMQMQHKTKQEIRRRSAELLTLVGLAEMGSRYPHQLSGGQQQRIALARALAIEPQVLLLDEPLSALDARVRVNLRNEIRRIQQQLKMTAIYVTHDQEEALAISDRIAVIAKGSIEQLDTPEIIYNDPRTAFAATFIGNSNQLYATVISASEGLCKINDSDYTIHISLQEQIRDDEQILVIVRPEDVTLQPITNEAQLSVAPGRDNTMDGKIEFRTFLGSFTRVQIRLDSDMIFTADMPHQEASSYQSGQEVRLSFAEQACKVVPLQMANVSSSDEVTALS